MTIQTTIKNSTKFNVAVKSGNVKTARRKLIRLCGVIARTAKRNGNYNSGYKNDLFKARKFDQSMMKKVI